MPTRAHRSPSSLASWGDGDDNDDEAVWPGISEAIRASLEDSGLASTSAPSAIPSGRLSPPDDIASSNTPVPRRIREDRRGEGPNPYAMSDLRIALEQPPELQPRRPILRNTLQAGGSSSTHHRHESIPASLPFPIPVAPQPRPHDSWYSPLQSGTTPAYQMLPTPSPSHPPSAPYLGANLSWPETPSSIAFPMTINTTEVDEGWSTVDPAFDHGASVLFPTREAYPPVYSAAAQIIDATGLPLYPSQRPASDEAPATRPRRQSTPRAVQPRLIGRDIATGQPTFHAVDITTEQMVHIRVDSPSEWRQMYAKNLVCENVCHCHQSRLIPSRFSIKWPQPDSIRRAQLNGGQGLTAPPTDIEQSLAVECMICQKIHCRGCWNGEYPKANDPFPAGCIRTDSCIMRRVIATFEALRSFDEHYLRFCAGDTPTEPRLVSTSKAGRYLALQTHPVGFAPAVISISTGLAAFVHTLSIIEYYLVRTAMNAHDGYVDVPEAYARMLEFSFIPRMIDELFSEPYRRRDVQDTYATTYRHVFRFLEGYNDLFPVYVRSQRWDFTLSCGIGMFLRGEGEIDWKASGTPCAPSFLEAIQAFLAPEEPASHDIATSYNIPTSSS